MILDPVSRYRIVDALLESNILIHYEFWLESFEINPNTDHANLGAVNLAEEWLKGLREAGEEDSMDALAVWAAIIEEERDKRVLTEW